MFNLADFGQLGAFESLGAVAPGLYEQAQLYMDFRNNAARVSGAWSSAVPLLTTTRASVAQMDTSDGWWGQFAANAPRWSDKGLLVEELRTNSLRNNTMVGAVAGSPGTIPTNWYTAGSVDGLTQTIVGVGNELGIDYVDIRWVGTANTTRVGRVFLTFDQTTQVPAASGQIWTASLFAKLAAGSLANVSTINTVLEYSAGGAFLVQSAAAMALDATLTRYALTRTLNNASTAFVTQSLSLTYNSGAAVDFTIRIGWPQLEQGAFVTSPIKTTTTAQARAADMVSTPAPAGMTAYSLWAQLVPWAPDAFAANQVSLQVDNGTVNERLSQFRGTTGLGQTVVTAAGVAQAGTPNTALMTQGARSKHASGHTTGATKSVVNGAAVQTSAPAASPASPTTLRIANNTSVPAGSNYIERAAVWNTLLTDAQLQSLTAP